MAVDEDVLLGARNGFLVVILVLLILGLLEIYQQGSVSLETGGTWLAGVAVFYASKWYYGRTG